MHNWTSLFRPVRTRRVSFCRQSSGRMGARGFRAARTRTFPDSTYLHRGWQLWPIDQEAVDGICGEAGRSGRPTIPLFYADDHQPALPHECQFRLDSADAQHELAETLQIIRDHTK